MKKSHFLKAALFFIIFYTNQINAQPSNEVACFDNFEYNNSSNSKMNAYLLAMVVDKMYPRFLLNVPVGSSEANTLLRNPELFETEFKTRLGHWFKTKNKTTKSLVVSKKPVRNVSLGAKTGISKTIPKTLKNALENPPPVFDFITSNNNVGYDPEAMIISTKDYIILAWRGTDRVANNITVVGDAIFNFGEWIGTNLNYGLINAPNGIQGQVHRGFSESIQEDRMIERVANRLKELGVANKKLWITGHSLGGAHAQISALYLQKNHQIQPFAVYAYASPGVGNAEFHREIERVVPGSKLQRFVFMDDPVPNLPSGLTTITHDYGSTRAGQLNYYSQESGNNNYHYNAPYREKLPLSAAVCMHNPHWYARAAYFELLDRNPTLRKTLPNAPGKPTEYCQIWDMMAVEGNGHILQGVLGINEDLTPGTYYIINASTEQFLNLRASDVGKEKKPIMLSDFKDEPRFKWRIRKVREESRFTPLGGYTIGIGSKIIDADRLGVGQQNSEVFTYNRNGGIAALDRRNQEWEIERNNDGSFNIKNILNTRFSLKAINTNRIVLDDYTGSRSNWYFVKVN